MLMLNVANVSLAKHKKNISILFLKWKYLFKRNINSK